MAAQVGSATVMTGQTLSVGTGKAEILLTPGTFLRVGNGGAIRMASSDLADPQVEVIHGEAMVEVDYKPKAARMDVMELGADTQLLKEGLYKFDAERGSVEVIDGKASVAENGRSKDIGKGKELMLAERSLKPRSTSIRKTKTTSIAGVRSATAIWRRPIMPARRTCMWMAAGVRVGGSAGTGIHTTGRTHGCRMTDSSGVRLATRSSPRVTWSMLQAVRIRAYGYGGVWWTSVGAGLQQRLSVGASGGIAYAPTIFSGGGFAAARHALVGSGGGRRIVVDYQQPLAEDIAGRFPARAWTPVGI